MPLLLDNIRAEFARFLAEDPNARFRMDAALAHVATVAYQQGLGDGRHTHDGKEPHAVLTTHITMQQATDDQLAPVREPMLPLGFNRQGGALLCYAWGETDRPVVMVARTYDDVRRFIVAEWLGVEDAIDANFEPELPKILDKIDSHDWNDGALEWEFEIGGVRIEDVSIGAQQVSDDPFSDSLEPWPLWATGRAQGYTDIGAQLCTRDGRKIGNAVVVEWPIEQHGLSVAKIVTDAGTTMLFTEGELAAFFHCPVFLMDAAQSPGATRTKPLPASIHPAAECSAAFEWLRIEATKEGADPRAGVVLDELHALATGAISYGAGKQAGILLEELVDYLRDNYSEDALDGTTLDLMAIADTFKTTAVPA